MSDQVRGTHPYCYRSGEWAEIVTTLEHDGKECWLVRFPADGATDFWVVDDPRAGYEHAPAIPKGRET